MSHTVSRGYHTARRWRTIAVATHEQLSNSTPKQVGAWIALEQFLMWTLEGLGKEPRKAPVMAGVCALSIAQKVFSALHEKTSLRFVERKTRKYLRLAKATRELKRTETDDVKELRRFLTELARQGVS